MGFRIRLVPVTIFVATLMLSVKLSGIWTTISDSGSAVQVTPAVAQQAPEPKEEMAAKPEAATSEKAETPSDGKPMAMKNDGESETSDVSKLSYSEIRLLQELAERRKILTKRERELNQREVLLKAAQQKLVEKQEELKKIRLEIKNLLNVKNEEESKRLVKLVNIYSNMKPKDAANIFNELEMAVLLDVMQSMKERKVAPIIAAMDPKRARLLTRQLAERQNLPNIPK